MNVLGITDVNEAPSPDAILSDLWLSPDRESILNKVCKQVLDNNCTIRFHAECDNDELAIDQVELYASDVLTLGLLYMEFTDAIQEGDGPRIIRCYRYFLPLFMFAARTNYSNEVLLLLYNIECKLTPRQSEQLVWCRTINHVGLPGHNIPCDLYLEHLNRLCKDMIDGMGSNKTEKSIQRIGKCVGPIKTILERFDISNDISQASGTHSIASLAKDQTAILKQLMDVKVFEFVASRTHKSFAKSITVPVTNALEKDNLRKWMIDRLKKYNYVD